MTMHAEGHRAEVLDLPVEPQNGDQISVLTEPDPEHDVLGSRWMDGWLLRSEPWGLWWVPRDSGEAILTPWRKIAEVDAGWIGEPS